MDRLRLFAVGVVCFCAGGLYGWSALIAPLQAAFDVSTAQTGLVFSIAIVCFTLSVVAAPHFGQHMPPLRRVAVFAAGASASLLLASSSPNYPVFVLFFSGGFGTFSGAIYISAVAIAAQSAIPLRATPLMVAAFGIGGAIFGPAWRMLGDAGGDLAALWPLAIALALCAVFILRLSGHTGAETSGRTPRSQDTPTPIARTGFVLIWLIFAFGSFGGLMVLGLAAKMLDAAQASIALSSFALAGIAIGNTLGRLSVAGLAHYLRPIASVFVSLAIGGAGLVLTGAASDSASLAAGLCLIAGGYGVMASAIPSLTRAIYGAAQFQRRFAFIFSAWGIAGFCAPWVAGAIFDATGSFDLAVYLAICATALSFASAVALQLGLRGRQTVS